MRLLRLIPAPLLLAATAQASLRAPYVADADTAFLFHFEENAGATAAANAGTAGGQVLAYSASAYPGDGVAATASTAVLAGAASFTGFGQAATIGTANQGLGHDGNNNGGFVLDDGAPVSPDRLADHSVMLGAGNAFTIEALVNLSTALSGNREIVSTDSGDTVNANRGFQFRFNNANLEFNWIGKPSGTTGILAPVPTTGANAFATNTWFHVAVAYDGATLRFYWTRLDADRTEAALIHSVATDIDPADDMQLVLGNEGRGNGGSTEGLVGRLDQVRISKVARAATDFVFSPADTDGDGLPDAWEQTYFGDLDETAEGDPDADGQNNLQEYVAGTHPLIAPTPDDTDGDGLPDAWELAHFGNLARDGAGDPDADGQSNSAELAAGSAPGNAASTSTDTDADGLPDAWEQTHFATLARNAGDDTDGDGFGNLQEHAAATSPVDPASRPAGTAVRLVPVDDSSNMTSEFGYAGSSAINSVAFVRSSLQTFGDQQFMTWYGRHQHSASAPFNNTIWIGRRTTGSSRWEVFKHPSFTANTITDGHDVISFGIDGDGHMHLSWGMHGDDFHYSKSLAPVTGSAPIELGPDTTMVGHETIVTYPQFLRLPDGDLLYLFRRYYSGNGAQFLNRYSVASRTWSAVHTDGNGAAVPFISGMWAPAHDYNPYVNMPQLGGPDGRTLTLTFNWRYLPVNGTGAPGSPGGFSGYQTNNNLNFARSTDAGLTWQKFDGTPYALPITRDAENGVQAGRAELIQNIPEGYSLINQAGMCLDAAGNPVTATWWAPETGTGNFRRQYMVHFRHADGSWQARAITARSIDSTGTRHSESTVRDLGRPIVVTDDVGRIIVAYRDNQGANGLSVVHSLPLAEDPDRLLWIGFDLTNENLGNYEPIIDNELWDSRRQLHFLHQASEGLGYVAPSNLAARISVLEWDAADYFTHSPQPGIETIDGGAGVRIHWRSEPSWSYRLQTSTDLINWTPVEAARLGTGATFEHRHTLVPGEPKRFWRLDRVEGVF